jgi:hypothetical protein
MFYDWLDLRHDHIRNSVMQYVWLDLIDIFNFSSVATCIYG